MPGADRPVKGPRPLLLLDFDSTMVGVEGIDLLAEHKLTKAERDAVRSATAAAMDGTESMTSALQRRLELVRPSVSDCQWLAQRYADCAASSLCSTLQALLRSDGWRTEVVSGGLAAAIDPALVQLGLQTTTGSKIVTGVTAVHLIHDDIGEFVRIDGTSSPTAAAQGKAVVVRQRREAGYGPIIVVGDGATDAEASADADGFVATTEFANRPAVTLVADAVISQFSQLTPELLQTCLKKRGDTNHAQPISDAPLA